VLRVAYPAPGDAIDARDSSFLLGSTGTGAAELTINGQPVPVAPNRACLAWIALPPDSVMRFDIVARTPSDSARLTYDVPRAPRPAAHTEALWIDTASVAPRGRAWVRAGEQLTLRLRASEGAAVSLRLPGGGRVPLVADRRPDDVPAGIRAFDRDTLNLRRAAPADRYVGTIPAQALGADPGPVVGADTAAAPDTAVALLEAVRGSDTARVRLPIRVGLLDTLPTVVRLDDDSAGRGTTDSLTIGRALPGGTYTWFFPTGTRVAVLGRVNGDLHARLSDAASAWIPVADAHPEPRGTPVPRAVVGSITASARPGWITLRIPCGERAPFRVLADDRALTLRLYGAVGDVDWIRYGPADSLLRRVTWHQAAADEVEIAVMLSRPVWGWRTRWDGNDLLLDVRRPPAIDRERPFQGRLIVVDPGHPPAGATGPTGLREAQANLGVALELRAMLEAAGARVLMTRTTDSSVELLPRTRLAERADAELLVSIHNNALPDGVNPLTNNGTSVFYNHSPSVPLARAVDSALVARFGTRDLGIGRGDLALVRPTWMPAILTEGLYMIVPEQEAALRSPVGQRLYAEGVFAGIECFLREAAER
jgi:N-acetylmuramoyl-L-alanine amidase